MRANSWGAGPALAAAAMLLMARAAAASPTHLHYTGRLHGVALLDIDFCLAMTDTAYDARLKARTLGMAEWLAHGRLESHATGAVNGVHLAPRDYTEMGHISGEDYTLSMHFDHDTPTVASITPPAEKYRQTVPTASLPGAIDGISAIAFELLTPSRTGACLGSALIFDGRQLRRLATSTAGEQPLAASSRSVFAGKALRCDTQSFMLAGFLKDQKEAPQRRPRASTVWVAPLSPGGPDLPVRMAFDADAVGDIVVDLDHWEVGCQAGG